MVDEGIALGHFVSVEVLRLIRPRLMLLILFLTPLLCGKYILFLDMQVFVGDSCRILARLPCHCPSFFKRTQIFVLDEELRRRLTTSPVMQPPD